MQSVAAPSPHVFPHSHLTPDPDHENEMTLLINAKTQQQRKVIHNL